MNTEPQKPTTSDPNTWPVVECEVADVFLGSFDHDCTPDLTDEQKTWPVADAAPTDVFLGSFDRDCAAEPADTPTDTEIVPGARLASGPAPNQPPTSARP